MNLDLRQFQERSLPASEFADRAFAALEGVPDDIAIHLRVGDVKKLIEEILPIAVFAKRFDAIERRVHCKYLGASDDDADAEITLNGRAVDLGFYAERLLIEATCAEDDKAYLRREALARHGGVFTGKNIRRIGRRGAPESRIESVPDVRDGGSGPIEMAGAVRAAVDRKAAKKYSPERVLVVRLDPDFPVNDHALARVVQHANLAAKYVGLLAIFIVDCSTASIMQTWSR